MAADQKQQNADTDWATTIASELRDATRALHHRLDHSPRLAPLVRPGLTLSEYGKCLQALYAINHPIELRIAEYISAHALPIDYEAHRRIDDLAADLQFLGLPLPAPAWSGPLIDSPGALTGCFYVLAGSTLGGRVIFRQLQAKLAVDAQNGAKFFAGHGEQTMAKWQAFWAFAAAVCPAGQLPAARESAAGLFDHFLQHLEASPQ